MACYTTPEGFYTGIDADGLARGVLLGTMAGAGAAAGTGAVAGTGTTGLAVSEESSCTNSYSAGLVTESR